jgi:large subunit ribosomal protein L4
MAKAETKEVKKKVAKKAVAEKTVKAAPKPKTVAKPVKKETVKAEAPVTVSVKPMKVKATSNKAVSIAVMGIDGKADGTVSLPGEIFGERVNKVLLAQAIRVYLANQRQGNASTKTRGEVDGSTRKIFRQKGTGRARHGSVRAPIFVKGGIVFGPKPRDFGLSMPKKMKRKALFSALSSKVQDSQVTVLSGLEKLEPKTKNFVGMLKNIGIADKKPKFLFVTPSDSVNAKRAGGNLQGVSFTSVNRLNAYEVLNTKHLMLAKEAIAEMEKAFLGKDK